MAGVRTETSTVVEGRVVHVADRPITLEQFLEQSDDRSMELVDGALVEKTMVQLEHERLSHWFDRVVGTVVERLELGVVLGSRTPVRVTDYRARLPDILFVRRDQLDIVQHKAVMGAPDLVVEIVSPNDRASDIVALEADYRTLAVPEIAFVDLPRGTVRLLRRRADGDYDEQVASAGALPFASLGGLTLQAEWLLREPRPDELDTIHALLAQAGA